MNDKSSLWLSAAKRYIVGAQSDTAGSENDPVTEEPSYSTPGTRAIRALQEFMASDEGHAAMALLKASKRHIDFAQEFDECVDGQITRTYFMNGEGLFSCEDPAATIVSNPYRVLSGGKLTDPRYRQLCETTIIDAAVMYGRKKPEEILPWLRAEIDKIAEAAPCSE